MLKICKICKLPANAWYYSGFYADEIGPQFNFCRRCSSWYWLYLREILQLKHALFFTKRI